MKIKIVGTIVVIFVVIIGIGINYSNKNKPFIGLLFSDATQKDSEIDILNMNLNTKKVLKLEAIDTPMVSYINNNLYIPTSSDNKLFYIDSKFNISQKSVSEGATYIRTKKSEQLILYNLPINNVNGDKNRVWFSSGNKNKYIDIKKSLLLCGDFDNKFIYVIGVTFDDEKNPQTHLFIINKASLKLVDEKKLPDNITVRSTEIIDNKLLISSDVTVDYFLYYDLINKKIIKVQYNKLIKDKLDVSKIVYNKNNVFLISLTGDVIKLNRKNFSIESVFKLSNKIIISADIKDDNLYLLSQEEPNQQIASINIIDTNKLKQIKQISIGPIRNTMPRDIFIYK